MKDLPENSQVSGDVIVSMSTETLHLNQGLEDDWQWSDYHPRCYLLLKPNTNIRTLEDKFPAFIEKREGQAMRSQHMASTLSLEPLKDVYLYSTRDGSKNGNYKNVYLFSFVAAIILLIACINFVNLTTARSAERAKEVGIRKVIGALQAQLAGQFAGESIMLCLAAACLSLLFAGLLIPEFNQLSGKTISHGVFEHPAYVALLFAASLGIGLLAGIYPALVLSSFKPSIVLKGRFATGSRGSILRKGLVFVQFTLSIAFIIATIVVYNQLKYMRDQDLGFDKQQLMIINTEGDPHLKAFRQSLKEVPGVVSASLASDVPGTQTLILNCQIENAKGDLQVANMSSYFVDWDYIDQYKIKMVAGRAFSRDFQTDTTQAMVINEAAAKMFGYPTPQQAVGRRFSQVGRTGRIIGVMKDFISGPCRRRSNRSPCVSSLITAILSPSRYRPTIYLLPLQPLKTNGRASFPTGRCCIISSTNILTGSIAARKDSESSFYISPFWPSSSPAWACLGWPRTASFNGPKRSPSGK
jgi:putative ABC transport system permease protein